MSNCWAGIPSKPTWANMPDKDAHYFYVWSSLHRAHIIAPKECAATLFSWTLCEIVPSVNRKQAISGSSVVTMRARWSSHLHSVDELPKPAQTVVASWWPGRYYLISTIQLDTADPLAKLTESLETGTKFEDVPDEITGYVTQVFRCTRHLVVKSFDNPLYEQEYDSLQNATRGHEFIVQQLLNGSLRFTQDKKRQ